VSETLCANCGKGAGEHSDEDFCTTWSERLGHYRVLDTKWQPIVTSDIELRCKDDPEANGRKPQIGEQRYTLTFPLENGTSLQLHMGKEGMNTFTAFVGQMMIDDSAPPEASQRDK
jgi:hypothetical protein